MSGGYSITDVTLTYLLLLPCVSVFFSPLFIFQIFITISSKEFDKQVDLFFKQCFPRFFIQSQLHKGAKDPAAFLCWRILTYELSYTIDKLGYTMIHYSNI